MAVKQVGIKLHLRVKKARGLCGYSHRGAGEGLTVEHLRNVTCWTCLVKLKRIEEMKKEIKCKWYSDPAHGWLRVPANMLYPLGVHDEISTCSYEHGRYVYLEEDCDAKIFMDKAIESGYTLVLTENKPINNPSGIRRYPSYNKENHGSTHDDQLDATAYAASANLSEPPIRRRRIL